MAERRTYSVVTLSVEDDSEILGYLGFTDENTTVNEDGSTDCEISHGGYRAEAISTGHGHIVAQIGPVAPQNMNGVRPDVTFEVRNGHSLAADGIKVDPPEKWVVTEITIRGQNYKYPDGDIVNAAASAIRSSTAHLTTMKDQFRRAARAARAPQNRPRL